MIRVLLIISMCLAQAALCGCAVTPREDKGTATARTPDPVLIVDESTKAVFSNEDASSDFPVLNALTAQLPEPLSEDWIRQDADGAEKLLVYPAFDDTGSSVPVRMKMVMTNRPGGGIRCRLFYLDAVPAVTAKLYELAANAR